MGATNQDMVKQPRGVACIRDFSPSILSLCGLYKSK